MKVNGEDGLWESADGSCAVDITALVDNGGYGTVDEVSRCSTPLGPMVGTNPAVTLAELDLTRFGGHPNWRENAPGVSDGKKQEAEGVQP